MWGFIYVVVFLTAFLASVVMKMTADPFHGKYTVKWDESVGTVYADLSYGEGAANKFDLYVPADSSRDSYGLAVYLHAGGFTTGDKQDDQAMLQWLCSKGYVAAGINYTLRDEAHPEASVYSQSVEIIKMYRQISMNKVYGTAQFICCSKDMKRHPKHLWARMPNFFQYALSGCRTGCRKELVYA